MILKPAHFTFDGSKYAPVKGDWNAIGICAILSQRSLKISDIPAARSKGYEPRLENGEVIGKVDLKV